MSNSNIVYEDQSASELRLNLVQGAVDKKILTLLCTGEIIIGDLKIGAGIIGASHYFELVESDTNNVLFTEIFACKDLRCDDTLYYGDIEDASSIRKNIGERKYRFKVVQKNWNNGKKMYHDLFDSINLSDDNLEIALKYDFPTEADYPFKAVTLVFLKVSVDGKSIEVKTLHAYPNEDSLVFTETIIQPK